MTAYRSSLLQLLHERGYIHQATDAAALDAGNVAITFVQGNYDAVADPAVVAEIEDLTGVLIGLLP